MKRYGHFLRNTFRRQQEELQYTTTTNSYSVQFSSKRGAAGAHHFHGVDENNIALRLTEYIRTR
jgi:hypothetical protein